MDYVELNRCLSSYPKEHVNVFLSYLKDLETAKDKDGNLKNRWAKNLKTKQVAAMFKKVAIDGLYIDGDTIIITYRGKPMPFYTYHAYKNRLLSKYPDSAFDVQNVFSNDKFTVVKNSGKVSYKHVFGNVFDTARKVVGCYCVIKNQRGEFIETLNLDDIQDIRNSAKTQKIWNAWFPEMTLKSVIKRACKRHFYDVVSNIEQLDNEHYEPSQVGIPYELKEEVEKAQTKEDLEKIYKANIDDFKQDENFIELIRERQQEIQQDEEFKDNISETRLTNAIKQINLGGFTVEELKQRFNLRPEQLERLEKEVQNG